MANDTLPEKPYPGFPLYPHRSGYWAKKIRGKTHYFGRLDAGHESAEALYERQREDLHAGREPRDSDDRLTVKGLCDSYLAAGETRVANGEIQKVSWDDSFHTAKLIADFFGRTRPVDTLRVLDFEELRGEWTRRYRSVATVAGHIARTRAILRWAYNVELVDTEIRTGPNFKRPPASQFRRQRAEKPQQFFHPSEIHRLQAAASHQMRAIVMLGINAAFGNKDCGELEFRHLDLDGGWVTYARRKTGISRRAKLWPETLEALAEVIDRRVVPTDPKLRQRVLITKYGQPWSKDTSCDSPVSKEFAKLRGRLRIPAGRGFYALRHTFRTVADEAGDQVAARYVMGHVDTSIDDKYRESIADSRVVAVTDYVRAWYLAGIPGNHAAPAALPDGPEIGGDDSDS